MSSRVVRTRVLVGIALVVVLCGGTLAAITGEGASASGGLSARVAAEMLSQNVVAAIALSTTLMLLAALTPFPAEAVALANGAYFGAPMGLAVTWASALVGASVAFMLSRALGERAWRGKHRRSVEETAAWLDRNGGRLLLIARLVPLIPFFVVNFAAGFTRLSWRTYLLVSAFGILPFSTLLVLSGAGASVLAGL
jgi:uncharacterized membrane protein YdjX (TVP38/TMEM64 family)